MFCSSCGKEIKEGMKFCKYCGANLVEGEESKKSVISEEKKLKKIEEKPQIQERVEEEQKNTHAKPKRKSNSLFIILGIVVICIVAGSLIFFTSSQKKQELQKTNFTKTFKGAIGDKYKIQMELQREGDNLSGTYFYERIGKNLYLKGTVDDKENFTINAFDDKENQTDIFKGKFTSDNELSGTWCKPNGERTLPFSLQILQEAHTGVLQTNNVETKGKETITIPDEIYEYYAKGITAGEAPLKKNEVGIIQYVDLNEDGIDEIIVGVSNSYFCGATGNCTQTVFLKDNVKWGAILDESCLNMEIQKEKTNNFYNIKVSSHASYMTNFVTIYKWNGNSYKEFSSKEENI